ncbi:MAG: ABC transporter permease subunit [Acidobacteria bacterium]|nr:ABC transporter permease subunit [Acidobacteriota bacterium]
MTATLWLCARHELLLAARSRWLHWFAVVFAGLALLVASSGYVLSGGHGLQDFARTAVSLVQLVLLIVPLAALVFGTLTLAPERGAAELLYAQPVPRSAILAGRVLGLFLALAAAQLLGFGVAGLAVQWSAGPYGASQFLVVVALALVLTAAFLSVAAALASGAPGRRARTLAVALVVWFLAVVLFDLAALGIASLLKSGAASRLLITAALLNPVDAGRTGAYLAIEGTAAFGGASLALLRYTGGGVFAAALIAGSLLLWTVVPAWIAARRLRHVDF